MKQAIELTDLWPQTLYALEHGGVLLAVAGKDGKQNVMTIGWGAVGNMWGKRIFIVMVRPSRYTYELIEDADDFTVNVMPADKSKTVKFCGVASGRDTDKLMACELTTSPGQAVQAPVINEGIIHYECRILHKNDVDPDAMAAVARACYPQGDYHRLYYGEVVAAYADPDARERAAGPRSA